MKKIGWHKVPKQPKTINCQRHVYPPSTQIVCPRHIVQASLHRNTTMLPISQGSTKRPMGVFSSIGLDLAGSPQVLMPMSDQAMVGAMLFTCRQGKVSPPPPR